MSNQLYRHFDRRGRLLYVGVSLCTVARLCAHRVTGLWFKHISQITIAHYPSRKKALAAERRAIKHENPKFNGKGRAALNANDGKCFIGARVPEQVKTKLDRRATNERRSLANVIEGLLIQATATDPQP